jgi:hypothetical protein
VGGDYERCDGTGQEYLSGSPEDRTMITWKYILYFAVFILAFVVIAWSFEALGLRFIEWIKNRYFKK